MTKAKKKPRTQVGKPSRDRFVDEFMIDRNATQAAIRAGYSAKTAGAAGHRLLKTVEILAEINRRGSEQSQRLQITSDRIMERLALLDPLDLFNPDGTMKALADIPEDARRAIGGMELRELSNLETPGGPVAVQLRKIKFIDKTRALEDLAKIMGLMKERVEVTGKDGKDLFSPETAAKMLAFQKGQK